MDTRRSRGSLTVADMMETNTSLDVLMDEEREKLPADTEKSASRAAAHTELRVDEDGAPVRMDSRNEPAPTAPRSSGGRFHSTRARQGPGRRSQTAAGSSSTRRLRVRLESSGMPGPIVVVRVAFLM